MDCIVYYFSMELIFEVLFGLFFLIIYEEIEIIGFFIWRKCLMIFRGIENK